MERIHIQGKSAIVIICGPIISGKTSIALKILNKRKGRYISYEKLKEAIPRKATREEQIRAVETMFLRTIENTIENQKYAVIETPFIEDRELSELINHIRTYGYKSNITLIKVNLPEDIQIDYWQRKRGYKPSKKELLKEREIFEKGILSQNYSKRGVNEYVISNPNAVKYKFD